MEGLFTERADTGAVHVPFMTDAAEAEVVSTRSGDGLSEEVQTDGAIKLPVRCTKSRCSHHFDLKQDTNDKTL